MGWRLLIPVVGSAGIIYSVIGATNSNQRTEVPAETQSKHEWQVEVGQIGVELDCNGHYGNGTKKAIFKWLLDLNKEEREKLIRGQEIEKEAQVSLVIDGENKTLFPSTWNGIKVDTTKYGGILIVTSYYAKGTLGGTETFGISHREYDQSKFSCIWEGLKTSQENEIYRSGMLKGQDRLLVSRENIGLKVKVSLAGDCTPNEKKRSECSLKVITKDTDLDWSNKISTKAILYLK